MSLTIHMMTAALSPGDAIGNYILSLTQTLREWGATVKLYADYTNERYPLAHARSSAYSPTGTGILWMHYSIYSDNTRWLRESHDFKIIDSQNVCPAYLFHGHDAHMEELCARGEAALDTFPEVVDLAICHTEYVREDLLRRGFRRVRKLPMVVDTRRFTGQGDPAWEPLLSKLDYLVFVGRIVPQKNLTLALEVFAELRRRRPGVKFILVGAPHLPTYLAELEALAARLGLADDLVFTGPVVEPQTLTSFLRHARFYLCLSEWESFCVPLAESLFFDTPVLGWQVPPIPETMGPGGVQLAGDAAAMAAQIDALWEDTPRYATLQQAGRAHVASFTDHALRRELLALLGDLAEGL